MGEYVTVGQVSDFGDGALKMFRVGRDEVVVVKHEGQFYAFTNYCPHAARPMVDGYIEGTQIVCPYHGAAFEMGTGNPRYAFDGQMLLYNIRLEGDEVQVEKREVGGQADGPPPHLRFVSDLGL